MGLRIVDIKDMPNYNSVVRDNISSVSCGDVIICAYFAENTGGGSPIFVQYPSCKKHGAMNKVSKDGIWRCLSCGVGCYQVE